MRFPKLIKRTINGVDLGDEYNGEVDSQTKLLQTQSIKFAMSKRLLDFAVTTPASTAIQPLVFKLPFEVSFFDFGPIPIEIDHRFGTHIGALCHQIDPLKYRMSYLVTDARRDTAMWYPMSIVISAQDDLINIQRLYWVPSMVEADAGYTPMIDYVSLAVIKLIGLLNCKNFYIDMQDEKPSAVELRRRFRRNKKPLYEHKILDIDLSRFQTRNGYKSMGWNDLRAHLVRGHFKRRKSGIFWWSPFVRGNSKLGIITKDYNLNKD